MMMFDEELQITALSAFLANSTYYITGNLDNFLYLVHYEFIMVCFTLHNKMVQLNINVEN